MRVLLLYLAMESYCNKIWNKIHKQAEMDIQNQILESGVYMHYDWKQKVVIESSVSATENLN